MEGTHRVATPEQLAAYAKKALTVHDMAIDANNGVAYCMARRGRLDISDTVIALDFRQLAALAITYIQVAQVIRDEANAAVAAAVLAARGANNGRDVQ